MLFRSEIIKVSDGIILGRGDLIPETSISEVPLYQKRVIECAVKNNKNIIIGTHVLDNMKLNINPTLPEVESIFNHINSGVSGFLLSSETSIGLSPIRVTRFLNKIINQYV